MALDYDGTIAHHGKVNEDTIEALRQLKASKRKIILVTGRELDVLKEIFPEHQLFDRIVVENGALIYNPATLEERILGEKPPQSFIEELKKNNVTPLSVGRVIVATWEPNQQIILEVIRKSGIERQVIFNKGAVMILPAGINKAEGLLSVLNELNFSIHNVVAVGDAENDGAMLQAAECAVAVQNALPGLKEIVDWVTPSDHGAGVAEMIDRLLKDDLASLDSKLTRNHIEFGKKFDGMEYLLAPYRGGILLAGTSGGGKTTLTAYFLERLIAKQYQFCLVDPEGDYAELKGSVAIGDAEHLPVIDDIIRLLENPRQHVVVNTLAIPLHDRPAFFNTFLAALLDLRKRLGHPHWFIFDEAHHLIPTGAEHSFFNIPKDLNNFMLVTTEPKLINRSILSHTDIIIAMGDQAEDLLIQYASIKKVAMPELAVKVLAKGEAWVWDDLNANPFPLRLEKPTQLLQRHKKKYTSGDMKDKSFYFTGQEKKLNLKANNLMIFIQMAEGVDDDTWLYHLGKNEYSGWFRDALHDDELADITEQIEMKEPDPSKSKKAILDLVKEKYTASA